MLELGDEDISDILVLEKMDIENIMLCEKMNNFIQILLF